MSPTQREHSKRRTVKIEVHLKKGYEVWKKLFYVEKHVTSVLSDEGETSQG